MKKGKTQLQSMGASLLDREAPVIAKVIRKCFPKAFWNESVLKIDILIVNEAIIDWLKVR